MSTFHTLCVFDSHNKKILQTGGGSALAACDTRFLGANESPVPYTVQTIHGDVTSTHTRTKNQKNKIAGRRPHHSDGHHNDQANEEQVCLVCVLEVAILLVSLFVISLSAFCSIISIGSLAFV